MTNKLSDANSRSRWLPILMVTLIVVFFFVQLSEILMPFIVGALIAYLGDPIVDRLEARGYSRSSGVVIVFALLMTLVIVVSGIVVPLLIQQLSQLAAAIPDAYLWVSQVAVPYLQTQLSLSPVSLPTIDWQTSLSEHWQSVGQVTGGVVQRVTTSSLSLIALLLNVALIPVVAFYLMRDWDLMMAGLLKLVPRVWASTVQASVSEAHTVLEAFLRGQLVVMGAQALMYSVGLWVVGLNYAVVLGVTAGVASLIPYAGSVIGVGSAMVVAYFQYGIDPWSLGAVALIFLIGQLIESFLLTPILVGDRIGLHPVAVIFALMAGGQLAGFTGVLIALPVAAVLLVFGRRIVEVYLSTDAYNAE